MNCRWKPNAIEVVISLDKFVSNSEVSRNRIDEKNMKKICDLI